MKFMCDEMREGLLAGKKYRRLILDKYESVASMDRWKGLGYKMVDGSVFGITTELDMRSEWEEVIDYTLTFPEAMAAMNDGKTVENDNKCPYRIEVSDNGPILYFMYEGEWLMSKIPIISLMLWKWRIVE